MFSMYQPSPYYPLPTAYHQVHSISPRDKYLAAVAEAEAARASYLADETARQEEEQLERRLQQLRLRRIGIDDYSALRPSPRERHIYELRRELEEEERRQEQLRLAAHRAVEQERARVARLLAEQRLRDRLEHECAGQNSSGHALARGNLDVRLSCARPQHGHISSDYGHRRFGHPHHLRAPHRSHPAPFEALTLTEEQVEGPTRTHDRSDEVSVEDILAQLFGTFFEKVEARQQPTRPTACARAPMPLSKASHGISKPFASASKPSEPALAQTAPQPDTDVVADLASQFLGIKVDPQQVKSAVDAFSAFAPMLGGSSQSSHRNRAPLTEQTGLEDLLSSLFGGVQDAGPSTSQTSASSSKIAASSSGASSLQVAAGSSQNATEFSSKPTPAFTSKSASTSSSKPASASTSQTAAFDPLPALRARLATRLSTEEEAEIRDTMHAIMLSLEDQEEKFKTEARASSSNATQSINSAEKATSSTERPSSIAQPEGKGKGRASPEPTRAPTHQDIDASLDTIRNIEAAFAALSGDFAWPTRLDFTSVSSREASVERASSPTPSTPTSASPLSKLAYTARNQPVRFYEQALSALLAQLDAVESWGAEPAAVASGATERVRAARRGAVGKVEHALEEVEAEVEGRWAMWMRRAEREGRAQVKEVTDKVQEREKANEEAQLEEPEASSVAESVATIRPATDDQDDGAAADKVAPAAKESPAPVPPLTADANIAVAESLFENTDAPHVDEATTHSVETHSIIDGPREAPSAHGPVSSPLTDFGSFDGIDHAAFANDVTAPSASSTSTPSSSSSTPSSSPLSSPPVDTFLLPADATNTPAKGSARTETTDSDWSEVEA
ncbi:hypothetical protein HDZ31DRAFT_59729 [Schizophyllum fasciatum]